MPSPEPPSPSPAADGVPLAVLRSLFENAAVGMAQVGLPGTAEALRWLQANEALCRFLGRSLEELRRLTVLDVTHPDDARVGIEHAPDLLAGSIPSYTVEKRYLRPDGTVVWGRVTGSLARDADGRPLHQVAVIEDVTARRSADERMRAKRHRLSKLQVLTAELAAARAVADVARAAVREGVLAAGAPRGTLLRLVDDGRTLALLAAAGYTDAELAPWRRFPNAGPLPWAEVVRTRTPVVVGGRAEYLARYPALAEWVEATGVRGAAVFPLIAGAGAGAPVLGVLAFDYDREQAFSEDRVRFFEAVAGLSAQALDRALVYEAEQRAREAAEAERRRLALVLDRLPVGVMVVDPTGALVHYNPASERVLGHPMIHAGSVDEYASFGALHPDGRPYAAEDYPVARVLLRGESVDQEPMRYVGADGEERTLSVSATGIPGPDGRLAYVVTALVDVTEREDARREAEAANRAKAEFLATMSHELRTPLNAISGHVQLLEMGLHGPVTDAQRRALGRVQHAQRHLLRLINDVLNYAKLEAGRLEYDVRPVALSAVLDDVRPLIEPQMAAKGLAFAVEVDDAAQEVWADREKLQQVLLNLLSNAVKFTPAAHGDPAVPGRVVIDAPLRADGTTPPDACYLRVRDTGPGIPIDKLEAVFEPFVQVDSSRTRATEGTGLGLAISRDLMHGMGGGLRARSAPGVGASFTATLRRTRTRDGGHVDLRSRVERRQGQDRRSERDRRAEAAAA